MALSELQTANVQRMLRRYCEGKVPPAVRDRVQLDFRIRGQSVELFERRPAFNDPSRWVDHNVAKFQYVATTDTWRLFCQHRDLKWHGYQSLPEAESFEELLEEVEADPTGISWG